MKRETITGIANGSIYLCGLVMLLGFALMYAFKFVTSKEIDCVWQTNATYNCHTRTLLLDWVQTSDREYVGVVNILMNENCDDEGCMYSTIFVTENGDSIPLSILPENDRQIASEQVFVIGTQMAQGSEYISYKTNPFRGSLPLFCYVAVYVVVVVAVLVAKDRYIKYRQHRKTR